jgi:hypothetical protein
MIGAASRRISTSLPSSRRSSSASLLDHVAMDAVFFVVAIWACSQSPIVAIPHVAIPHVAISTTCKQAHDRSRRVGAARGARGLAALFYLPRCPARARGRGGKALRALPGAAKSLNDQCLLAICKDCPIWSSKSGPMVGDSSTADYRILGEVIDIARLVLEIHHLTGHLKPTTSARFPKL